ncbi:MAG: polymer-forming cytoskeletal protein [Caldilineales bacterium]|nr:polymer-forming cytoskeletal protein [Caldilineales bacterium]
MFRKDRRPAPDRIDLTIGPSVTLRGGELKTDASVRIDGVLEEGRIETLGNVVIGAEARVQADIQAETVSVAGAFKGHIQAQRVEILAGGRVWGRVEVATFFLDEGGFLHAELVMTPETPPEQPFAEA